jgi:pilus assembly protein Flp/PilA
VKKLAGKLIKSQDGATAVEYGLIVAFIAMAIVAALPTIKTNLSSTFTNVANNLGNTSGNTTAP